MYGGIRGGARAGLSVAGLGVDAAATVAAGSGVGSGGNGSRQRGAPYAMPAAPVGTSSGTPAAYQMLLVLVGLEVAALVGLRRGFRHHHGG